MTYVYNNKNVEFLGHRASLGASLTANDFATFNVDKLRTCVITARLTYNASSSAAAKVNIYFSPDGEHWDTVPYLTFDINLSAGEAVQESHTCDMPESGFAKAEIVNGSAHVLTELNMWVVKRSWIGV
jgi:hypothetical protein